MRFRGLKDKAPVLLIGRWSTPRTRPDGAGGMHGLPHISCERPLSSPAFHIGPPAKICGNWQKPVRDRPYPPGQSCVTL